MPLSVENKLNDFKNACVIIRICQYKAGIDRKIKQRKWESSENLGHGYFSPLWISLCSSFQVGDAKDIERVR